LVCYVCKKPIRDDRHYGIGKNDIEEMLYRHIKCSPNTLSNKQIKEVKENKIVAKPKRRRK